jgi:hypothetical protein
MFVFRQLETPQLSLDRIIDFLAASDLSFPIDGDGLVRAGAVPRRMILSTLSNSKQFVRSGPAHIQTWALRPNNPFFQADSAVVAAIDQFLTKNGPATLDEILLASDTPGALRDVYERVIFASDEFHALPDGRLWFRSSPVPTRAGFDTVSAAINWGFTIFHGGATIEELRRLLCLSITQGTPITRLEIAQELAAKPDAYVQVQRGKYALAGFAVEAEDVPVGPKAPDKVPRRPLLDLGEDEDEVEPFNPESFFGGRFSFSPV